MHIKKFPSVVAVFAAALAVFFAAKLARADSASHLIINEIQTAGASGNDEFIEIFNPTDAPISLDGFKLSKKTKSGAESTLLSSTTGTKFSGVIQSYGYFLISHPSCKEKFSADLAYASSLGIANDNAVLLYDKNGVLLDKVGYGSATVFEGAPAQNPDDSQSIERKNFSDTDDNSKDFSLNISPSPKNKTVIENSDNGEPASDDNDEQNSAIKCAASSEDIKINEVFPYPAGENEFVEIKNTGADCVDVSGWKVMDEAGHKKTFSENSILEPGEYLHLEGNLYLNNDSDTVYLLDANGGAKNDALDKVSYEKAKENYSYALSDGSFSWTSVATPGERNIITNPEAPEKNTTGTDNPSEATGNYSSGANIYLNEILPNPRKKSDDEFIEIASGASEAVDLFGWKIKDASKSKGHQFKDHIILSPGEYFTLYGPDSKIALNNSNESVYLLNPKGEIVSSATFEKSRKNASYNFDGKNWKWSKYFTPGKKNKFDSAPTVKIKRPKKVYKNLIAEFSVKAEDKETKKLKYTWDFGDGKKSSLQKPSHKYLATGKYTVTLAVSDDSQTVEKSFVVNVKNSPRPDLEIVKIVPNPAGNDSEGETVDVHNNSSKKVDVAGWKIATGSGEKMNNHPVSGKVSINPDETKTITREFSKFSLNNKSGKVQLVMPDGKIIDEVEYQKEKIAENEAYVKNDGQWEWLVPDIREGGISHEEENIDVENTDEKSEETGKVLGAEDEKEVPVEDYYPNFSSENAFAFLTRIGFGPSPTEPNLCPLNDSSFSIAYLLASLI